MLIYDIADKQVFEENISVKEGINYDHILCSDFAKGLYVVKIEGETNSMREKVFIR